MMINDNNKKSISKMFKSRVLYVALGVCLLAAGAVSVSSMRFSTPELAGETTTGERITYKNVSDPIFHENVPEIKSPEPVSEKPTEALTQAAPVTQTPETQPEPETEAVFDDGSETLSEAAAENAEPISFDLPVNGALGRDYSMGAPVFSETMSDYRTHNGIDITAEAGRQVKTAAPGKVTAVISDPVWGNTVEIDHGQGYVSKISGLADEGLITEGSSVAADTPIGVIGIVPVEAKDAPHVHFELRLNGELQDPLEALGLTDTDD